MTSARWIALEGIDGSGKTGQVAHLTRHLGAVQTREPGGTDLGRSIRRVLLHDAHHVSPSAELMLYAADRAQNVASVVAPSLAAGQHVVSDRSMWSSVAYQGGGRGLTTADIVAINRAATGGLEPDFVVLLDLSPDVAAERCRDRGKTDRIEAEGLELQAAARDTFLSLAAANPGTWLVIDAEQSATLVSNRIGTWIKAHLGDTSD